MVKEAGVPVGGKIPLKRGKAGCHKPEGEGDKVTWRLARARLPVGITGLQARRPGQFRGIWVGLLRRLETRGQQALIKRTRGGAGQRPRAEPRGQGGQGREAREAWARGPVLEGQGAGAWGPGGRGQEGESREARARVPGQGGSHKVQQK